jgi:hypothetical protein
MDYQQVISGVDTSAAPAWTELDGKLLLVWKGEGVDTQIWFTLTSSATPAPDSTGRYSFPTVQSRVGALTTSANPTITTMGNSAYIAYRASDGGGIYWAQYSNGAWTNLGLVSFAGQTHGTAHAPYITSDGKALYMAWIDSDSGGVGWAASTDGKTWGPQQQVGPSNVNLTTDQSPAIAVLEQDIHVAWRNTSDGGILWAYYSGGQWSSPTYLKCATSDGPSLSVDGNKVLWLAWKGAGNDAGIYYKRYQSATEHLWTDQFNRYSVGTGATPALASTSNGPSGFMLLWKGSGSDSAIYYGPMLLPPQTLNFVMPSFHISNMRSGSLFGKTESDTDYVSLGVALVGQQPQLLILPVGNQTGGNVNTELTIPKVTIQDTDTVFFSYAIINSSSGPASSTSFLKAAGEKLFAAAEKAYLEVLQDLSGLPFSALTPQEEGAVIGAQLGGIVLPGLGVIPGAIAGWFVDSVVGFLWPNCDGRWQMGYTRGAPLRFGT